VARRGEKRDRLNWSSAESQAKLKKAGKHFSRKSRLKATTSQQRAKGAHGSIERAKI
jgi:hypothetical protein